MISGRSALNSIEMALQKELAEVERADRSVSGLSEQLLQAQRNRAQTLRQLARLRVGKIAAGKLTASIDDSDHQVKALLQQRRAAAAALAGQIEANEDNAVAQQGLRGSAADALEQAATAVDDAEADTQARLDRDPAYTAQRVQAQEAERTARHADDKATRSEEELEHKGQAYRDDRLFMYLWGRHYGSKDYRANNLIRWLDGKVAALVGYDGAKLNFRRLQELPLRLREHAEARDAAAKTEFEALKALDEQAREQDGIPALEADRKSRQAALNAIDARIEQLTHEHQELLTQQAEFSNGEDLGYRQAVGYLSAEYGRNDLQELRRDALATPYPEDDLLVSQLFDQERQGQDLQASVNELQMATNRRHLRLKDLQRLRGDFKRSGYDRPGSGFADGAMVATMLGNFLSGVLDRRGLWRVLRDQQRTIRRRSNPAFGSGGLGRGTVWGGSAGGDVLGDILGGLARGSRRGGFGGGFGGGRSGGGGGGGFRTGGGF